MPNKNYSLVKLYRQIYEALKGSDEQLDSPSDNDKMYFHVIMMYCNYLKTTYELQSEFTTDSLKDEPIVRDCMFDELISSMRCEKEYLAIKLMKYYATTCIKKGRYETRRL